VQCVSGEGPATTFEGFMITGGTASVGGGGMYNKSSSPTVANCTFRGNYGHWGGGVYNLEGSATVTNCTFTDNCAHSGGGMCNVDGSPMVTNCTFTGWAQSCGGGIYNLRSSPTVTNCAFTHNWVGDIGGGICNVRSSPTVTNCTFTDNWADIYGGGMCNWENSSPSVTNCILWSNSAEIYNEYESGGATVTYSDVQGGWPGEGNIDADPLFVNGATGDLHLLPGSPCIDAGDNAAVSTSTDLDGNPRIQGVAVDMGAYETTGSPKDVLERTTDIIDDLDPGSLTNPNSADALVNKFEAAIALIEAELYQDALMKLRHDILPKTDGCALRGQPDKDDWITTCEAQQKVYPLVLQTIQLLEKLI